jgi:hypothetical protein
MRMQANGGQVPAGSPVYVLYYFRGWDEERRARSSASKGSAWASGRARSPTAWT